MNLFVLDQEPEKAAQLNQDIHVRKICLEATQLLTNCFSEDQLRFAPLTQTGNVRKYSHIHHPVSKWVKETSENFKWALSHALALSEEFYYRFEKDHFCSTFIKWASIHTPELVGVGKLSEHPQCFKAYPELMVDGNPVEGYRNYYKTAKRSFLIRGKIINATWTNRQVPEWF